jgi:hypothetical protein
MATDFFTDFLTKSVEIRGQNKSGAFVETELDSPPLATSRNYL